MIKSLFGEDEEEVKTEVTSVVPKPDAEIAMVEPLLEVDETPAPTKSAVDSSSGDIAMVVPFEVDQPIGKPANIEPDNEVDELERRIAELELELGKEKSVIAEPEPAKEPEPLENQTANAPETIGNKVFNEPELFGNQVDVKEDEKDSRVSIQQKDFVPDTPGETIRKSGLAYSAAIALFGSVVFMLMLGWFADLLLGIPPWGTVTGIVIGAIIGFFQFFRVTSSIFKPKPNDFERVSLRQDVAAPTDLPPVIAPERAEPEPADLAWSDPELPEFKPAEPELADLNPAEPEPADLRPADEEPANLKPAEPEPLKTDQQNVAEGDK